MLPFRPITFVLACGLALAGAAAAGTTTAPASRPAAAFQPSPEVDALISRLTDPHWQIRNRAIERLVQLGASAEPQLWAARQNAPDVDSRARIELALTRIGEARRAGSTYVTLHLKGVSTRDALAAFTRATGTRFEAGSAESPGSAGPITLDLDHQPFWIVLRALCAQAKLEVASIDDAGTVFLRGDDAHWGDRPASIEGPYMLVARTLELTRSIDFVNPRNVSDAYTLVVLAYAEPKVRPIYWNIRSIDQCVTDTGREFAPSQNDAWATGALNTDQETRLEFTAPADAGRKLARLRLNASIVLSEKSETIDLPHLMSVRHETRTLGGWRVVVKGVSKGEGDRYSAAVSVYRDDHSPDEWTERMGLLDSAQPKLLDSAGKPLDAGGTSLNDGPDEWEWSCDVTPVNAANAPSRLRWDFPLQTRQVGVSFELRELPLP